MVCPATVEQDAANEPRQRLKGIRVVVVDDEEGPRLLFREILELEGAQVTAVSSAREAMAAMERNLPDVLVSDIMMPNEDGYWLIAAIRAMPPPRPRTVAVTGNAREHSRDQLLGAGYDAHLAKPVGVDTITAMVARLAGRAP